MNISQIGNKIYQTGFSGKIHQNKAARTIQTNLPVIKPNDSSTQNNFIKALNELLNDAAITLKTAFDKLIK